MESLAGRTAFITGGASGIGFGMARAFGDAGVRLALADIDEPALAKAEAELRDAGAEVAGIRCDVTDRRSLEDAAEETARRLGPVDVLCNNAGVAIGGPLAEMTADDWRFVLSVNLDGVANGLQVFLPRMRARGEGGHVVNTASLAGLIPPPGLGVYTASKYAVVGISEVLRQELEPDGIGVSVVCPGLVNTRIYMSRRLRPESLGGPAGSPEDAGKLLREVGMDPLEVGRKVRRAVERNDLYVITHPESRPLIERRFQSILDTCDARR